MKLLLDDDGHVVVRNGMPVYVNDDNKEIEVDVPRLFSKITDLNGENKTHREKNEELTQKISVFDGVEDLAEYRKTADDAITKVKNFSDKDLVEAGKVEEIRSAMTEAHKKEIDKISMSYSKKEESYQETISSQEAKIRKLMIGSSFKSSNYFVGDESVTLLPPDAAEALFGDHFKINESEDGSLSVIGYYDRNGKEMIYGTASPGDPASFDEAIEALVERYPDKNRILRAGKPGSSSTGGKGGRGGEKDEIKTLQELHAKQTEAGQITEAIATKNRIHRLQQEQRA